MEKFEFEEFLKNPKKNKGARTAKMFTKFKHRKDLYMEMSNGNYGEDDNRLRSTGSPCSCPLCKGRRYSKQDRKKPYEQIDKFGRCEDDA